MTLDVIIALVYLVVLASVPLARGRIGALAELPLRKPGLAFAAIGIQVVVISLLPGGVHWIHTSLHVFSYLLLGAFAWVNRRLAGVPIIAVGGLSNFSAIVANGGVMPADRDAIASLAHSTAHGDFANSQILAHPKLLFLGDVFATPASWPLHNVFSIGDIILVLGVAVLVHVACGSRVVPRRFLRPATA
jgi:Family of unknown function (DUF5317)